MQQRKKSFADIRQKVSLARKIIGGMVYLRLVCRIGKQIAFLGDNYPVFNRR